MFYAFIVIFVLAGQPHTFVLDTHQTIEDCGADVAAGVVSVTMLDDSTLAVPANATLACEAE